MVIRHAVPENIKTLQKTTPGAAFKPMVFLKRLCKLHREYSRMRHHLDWSWVDADTSILAPIYTRMHPMWGPRLGEMAFRLRDDLREIQGIIPDLPLPGWLATLADDFEKSIEAINEEDVIPYDDVEWRAKIFNLGRGLHHFLVCLRGYTFEAISLRYAIDDKRSTLKEERAAITKLYEDVCALYQS